MRHPLHSPPPQRRTGRQVGAVLVAGLTALALASLSAGAAERNVEIRGLSFIPEESTVAVGDTVTWKNFDSDHHDIEGDPLDSPELANGETYSYTFSQAGTFLYHCRIHDYMEGRVVVGDGGGGTGEPPTTSATTAPPPTTTTTTAPSGPGLPIGLPVPRSAATAGRGR